MKVTIEIKTLIDLLEAYNPSADLTGVKAYLLDLALGIEGSEPDPAPVTRTAPVRSKKPAQAKAPAMPPPVVEEVSESILDATGGLSPFAPAQPLTGDSLEDDEDDGMPANLLGQERKAGQPRTSVQARQAATAQERKAEREARRRKASDFMNMDTKDILATLTNTGGKRNDDGQFVNEGSDGPGGGDIEIG